MKAQTDVIVLWEWGLHMRPATLVVQAANQFDSDITIYKGRMCINAKSIMQVLTLEAVRGTQLTVKAEGEDAEKAIEILSTIFNNKLDYSDEEMKNL